MLKYRQRDKVLTVEKQLTDPSDVLERLKKGLARHHPPASTKNKRIGTRPALVATYHTRDEARAAERWIDSEFEV